MLAKFHFSSSVKYRDDLQTHKVISKKTRVNIDFNS